MPTALNLLVVSIVPIFALWIIYKKTEMLTASTISLILVILLLSGTLYAAMFIGDKFDISVLEKVFLTALGFAAGSFSASRT